jgi:hypothetical protein
VKSRRAVAEIIRRKLSFLVDPPLRDELLARVLQEQEQSWKTEPALKEPNVRRTTMRILTTRIAIGALICAGVVTGAVVGVSVKYHFVEKRPEQGYIVRSEDDHSVMNIPEKQAASPEQAVATAEEIARLRQAGQRELVGASEVEVNGQLDSRLLAYKYTLADGRTSRVGERDFEVGAPSTLVGERQAEAGRLFKQAVTSGQEPAIFERVIQGRTFTFKKYTFTLSDGTAVAWSMGRLKDGQ